MKKLLIALVTIAFATIVNAASIAWTFTTVPMIDENDEGGAYDGMLVYFVDNAGYSAFSTALAGGKDVTDLYLSSTTVGAVEEGFILGSGSAVSYNSEGDEVIIYAFIVDTANDAYTEISANGIVGSAALARNVLDLATDDEFIFLGDISTWESIGTTPGGDVPEPTSGLLLVLGVAGLVLKRKRA